MTVTCEYTRISLGVPYFGKVQCHCAHRNHKLKSNVYLVNFNLLYLLMVACYNSIHQQSNLKINPILSGTDSSGSDIQGCIVSLTPWLNHHKIYKIGRGWRDRTFTKRSKVSCTTIMQIPSWNLLSFFSKDTFRMFNSNCFCTRFSFNRSIVSFSYIWSHNYPFFKFGAGSENRTHA